MLKHVNTQQIVDFKESVQHNFETLNFAESNTFTFNLILIGFEEMGFQAPLLVIELRQ